MSATIYLDVDGVLNAVAVKNPSLEVTGWDDWQVERVRGFQIQFSPSMLSMLNDLATRPDVTIKWLTTWEDEAALTLSPSIGILGQKWEVLHGNQGRWYGSNWWKLKAIRDDVEATNPDRFIWIDDDISFEREAVEWVDSRATQALAISPLTHRGLTRTELESLVAFIDEDSEVAA